MNDNILMDSLCKYIGQTVTIFTTSGGYTGCGFTGVLAAVTDCSVKLITNIGAAPGCPIGSTCCGRNNYGYSRYGNYGCNSNWGCNSCNCNNYNYNNYNDYSGNWLGSVTEIPICKIASFTHNAI